MGYSTQFKGVLMFKDDMQVSQLRDLREFLGKDCRDNPRWGDTNLTYIDLEIMDDMSGIRWDGAEKTYDLVEKVNLIISNMRKKYPDFGFTGKLLAQGEDIKDRWILGFDDEGCAYRKDVEINGKIHRCPDCGHKFEEEK